jgi:hypothetical protein
VRAKENELEAERIKMLGRSPKPMP